MEMALQLSTGNIAMARPFDGLWADIARYPSWCMWIAPYQTDQYKGWMLVANAREVESNLHVARVFAASHGYDIVRWSTLSGNPDNQGEFGIRASLYNKKP